jgi:hypothetical protein
MGAGFGMKKDNGYFHEFGQALIDGISCQAVRVGHAICQGTMQPRRET